MQKKQITKNQHYVPQHYFRNFSNGEKFIAAHLLKKNTIIERCSIADQASKRFFYGDQDFEDEVCKVENKVRAGLNEIIIRREVTNSTKLGLIDYIAYQEARTSKKRAQTKSAWQTIQAMLDLSGREKTIEDARAWLKENKIEDFEPDEKEWHWRLMQLAIDARWQLQDLACLLLETDSESPFIFNDAPVALINPHMRNFKHHGTAGIISKGLIISFPLSNTLSAILYDKDVYRIKMNYIRRLNKRAKSLRIESNEVDVLNKLQYIFAENCVYAVDSKFFHSNYHDWRSENRGFDCKIETITDGKDEFKLKFSGILEEVDCVPELPFFDFEVARKFTASRPKPTRELKRRQENRLNTIKGADFFKKIKGMNFNQMTEFLSLRNFTKN